MASDAKASTLTEGPAVALSQSGGLQPDEGAADRAGDCLGSGPGQVVNAFLDQDPAGGAEVKTPDPSLQAAGTHGALLEEGGGEAALAKGGDAGERAQRVIAHDDDGLGEVELRGGGLKGEDPCLGLPADLMLHVWGVWKGAHMVLPSRLARPKASTVRRGPARTSARTRTWPRTEGR